MTLLLKDLSNLNKKYNERIPVINKGKNFKLNIFSNRYLKSKNFLSVLSEIKPILDKQSGSE